jgi:hypothetical protein
MPKHKHQTVTYETTAVVDEETGERATYTGCTSCGKVIDDPHSVAPTEE